MVKVQTEKGEISVNSGVYTNIAGAAASNCFGVKGMAVRSVTDGLIRCERNTVFFAEIDLFGRTEIFRYVMQKTTETEVKDVNVYIDSMIVG